MAQEEILIAGRAATSPVRTLLYQPQSRAPRGAILHMHGGRWIGGTADMMAAFCAGVAELHGVVVLPVEYRLAPEAPGDAAVGECFAALPWLSREAGRLGFPAESAAVMGNSAGGNLAACTALLARDADLLLAAQLLIYPALDDRTGGPGAPSHSS